LRENKIKQEVKEFLKESLNIEGNKQSIQDAIGSTCIVVGELGSWLII